MKPKPQSFSIRKRVNAGELSLAAAAKLLAEAGLGRTSTAVWVFFRQLRGGLLPLEPAADHAWHHGLFEHPEFLRQARLGRVPSDLLELLARRAQRAEPPDSPPAN